MASDVDFFKGEGGLKGTSSAISRSTSDALGGCDTPLADSVLASRSSSWKVGSRGDGLCVDTDDVGERERDSP